MKAHGKNVSSPIPELKNEFHKSEHDISRPDDANERQDSNFEQTRTYEEFVRSLNARIEHKLAIKLAPEVEYEIANFTGLLASMPRNAIADNRVYFEMAYDLLAAEKPNLLLIRSIRLDLAAASEKASGGISRLISKVCGETPLNASMAGLLTILILSILILIVFAVASGTLAASGYQEDVTYFFGLKGLPVAKFLLLVHAAFVGAIVSILARIGDVLSSPEPSVILIYLTIVSKPFLAAMFAIAVFAIIKIGMVSFLGVDLEGPNGPYFSWLIGFLCGFSERLSQDLVSGAGQKIGALNTLGANTQQPEQRNRSL